MRIPRRLPGSRVSRQPVEKGTSEPPEFLDRKTPHAPVSAELPRLDTTSDAVLRLRDRCGTKRSANRRC